MNLKNQKIAVVGADGFIGSNLLMHLRRCRFDVLSHSRHDPFPNRPELITDSFSSLTDVIWLASNLTPLRAEKSSESVEHEIEEFRSLIKFMEQNLPDVNLIYPSSAGAIYLSRESPSAENDPVKGFNRYGEFKLRIEELLQDSKLSFTILRISNAYGPSQPTGREQGVIAEWVESFAKNVSPVVFGDLSNSRDFVHIDDVVVAFERALLHRNLNCPINIGSGVSISLRKILDILSMVSGTKLDLCISAPREIDRANTSLDITRARTILQWTPTISIEVGIEDWLKPLMN